MNIVKALRKALDPRGPLGEVISPADVWKSRAGLPTQSPHTVRAQMEAPAHVEHTLAPARFASMDETAPPDRVRQVSAFVEEHWAPVYEKTDSLDLAAILLASQNQVGWTVTQRESEQSRAVRRARQWAEDESEIIQSLQLQPSDSMYYVYAPTIPGNDPVVINGEVLRGTPTYERNPDGSRGKMIHDGIVRGGTQIKGRRHYREVTKNFAHWDAGFEEQRAAALAEEASRPMRNVTRAFESYAGEFGPMWRPVSTAGGVNQRRDRSRPV